MQDDVARVAAGISALAGWQGTPQRLGGLTNRVYRLGDAILRIPGEGTSEYIDRGNEAVAARAAAAAKVSPEVLHMDAASGVMVTRFIDGTVTMTPEAFRQRPGAPARAALALRQLHLSGQVFPARFELFAMIDDYLALLSTRDVALPEGYHGVVAEAVAIRAALDRAPAPLVPCHCDPLCENFLDTGQRMWIVDWEYSGMNDPMWDLGDLAVEAGLSPEHEEQLLAAYFDGPPPPEARARMIIYKAMCDLLWTLWGLIQLANGNPADDFRAYADGRFARCRALMATEGFRAQVALLAGATRQS
jgi:thiamine kinase-like enzyme